MASIFSKIIAGEIPCYKVAEDENYFAFLDINPVMPGHTLVVPKHEVDYIFNLDEEEYAGLTKFARRVARCMKQVIECKKIAVAVLGLEVPHAHIHLIPISKEGDMSFSNKMTLPADEMAAIAKKIADEYNRTHGE